MDYGAFFKSKLDALREEGRYRIFAELERKVGAFPKANVYEDTFEDAREDITIWCSNDYLGMGHNPDVISAMQDAIAECGAGAGGTRNISGTTHYHALLEAELAALHKKDSALLFTSGYVANLTTLSTLGQLLPGCILYSDSFNHNSMIEGIRTARTEKRIFAHNDPEDLERLLAADDPDVPKIVIFESIYSMDGDVAPIRALIDVAKRYNALTFLDEVHAVGMYGAQGAGVAEQEDLMQEIDIIQGTMGKAFGVIGGYIAANADIVDFVRSYGAGFIFTTALPPAIAAGVLKSVQILRSDEGVALRALHQERAATLKRRLAEEGLPQMPSQCHIVPLLVGEPTACKQASDILMQQYGIYVQPINFPTVPRGTERLRLTPTPLHSDVDMDYLIAALKQIWSDLSLKKAA